VEPAVGAGHPRLLVLGAGPAQLGLLEAARARGVHVIAADRDPAAVGLTLADERAIVSTEDEPAIERLARAREVGGIVSPGVDWPVGVAARIAERLGLPHPLEAATGLLVTSKARQRERFARAAVPQPEVLDPSAPRFPCVVKSADRQGQRGLTLVREPAELGPAVALAAEESRSGGCLVEELIDGPELTVNAISAGGEFTALTVTDRLTAEPPAFGVALAHAWPSAHDTAPAVEAARAAAAAVGVTDGPTYTQVRLGPDGPRVMELAARLGGGHDAELCQVALGVDLNGLAIDAAFGLRSRTGLTPTTARGGACVVFLVAPVGVLRAVEGVEEAEELSGVRRVRVYRPPGWRFGPLRRGADRAGAVLAVGDNREDALANARRAAAGIRFVVDADGG
jgi:biotin carboxylase